MIMQHNESVQDRRRFLELSGSVERDGRGKHRSELNITILWELSMERCRLSSWNGGRI